MKKDLNEIYRKLLKSLGPQKWWPMKRGFKPAKLEICVGAVLTQNTSWKNVEKALQNMKKAKITTVDRILDTPQEELEKVIMPAGFYRQKAERLKLLAKFIRTVEKNFDKVERKDLLGIKGVGPETADSIMLYACNRLCFVVDAYTRRVFRRMSFLKGTETYEEIRKLFEEALPKDADVYMEYHALIVELNKTYCRYHKCDKCPVAGYCKEASSHSKSEKPSDTAKV